MARSRSGAALAAEPSVNNNNEVYQAEARPLVAPTLQDLSNRTAHPDSLLTFTAVATPDDVTYELSAAPDGADINQSGQVTWTPRWDQLGTFTFTVRVSNADGMVEKSCQVNVTNDPPTVNPLPGRRAHPGSLLTFDVIANDPDGDPLTYTLFSGPSNASVNASGTFTWTPTWSQLGAVTVVIRIKDPGNRHVDAPCSIDVANDPPDVNHIDDQSAHPGSLLTFDVQASDADGDSLTFSLPVAPPNASINASGTFAWTPNWDQVGNHNVTVRVTDEGNASVDVQFTVHVINAAPNVAQLDDQVAHQDELLRFDVDAQDPDGDPLTYEIRSGPATADINASGTFTWTPAAGDVGRTFTVTIRVSDPGGAFTDRTCHIQVLA